MDAQTHEEKGSRPARMLTLASLALVGAAMLALPAFFVLPDRIAGPAPAATVPSPNCSRLGPDFHPVRLRMPDGRAHVVCALFGFLGAE